MTHARLTTVTEIQSAQEPPCRTELSEGVVANLKQKL